jgi:hypothetical protein
MTTPLPKKSAPGHRVDEAEFAALVMSAVTLGARTTLAIAMTGQSDSDH